MHAYDLKFWKRIAERMNDRIGLLWDEFLTIDGSS